MAIHNGAIWPSDRPRIGIELNHDEVDKHILDKDDPTTM
jgi:hypothetical protein